MAEFRIRQNGQTVVGTRGPDDRAEAGILHYAMQYRQDGPLTIQRQQRQAGSDGKWYWKRHALFEQWPVGGDTNG
jgi:hypothetical protein